VLSEAIGFVSDRSRRALGGLDDAVATDIGLSRFLSRQGVFKELDPVKENQGRQLERRWDIETGNTAASIFSVPLVGEIEKQCIEIWNDCEKCIESIGITDRELRNNYYRELRRWITSITYRLGFFSEGKLQFEQELEEYQKILRIDQETQTREQKELIASTQDDFKQFVFITKNPQIKISKFLTVSGDGIAAQIKPKLDLKASHKTRLIMKIAGENLELSPRSFCWLSRKFRTNLSDKTFPPEVQQIANDIRHKAAAAIDYAFQDDVELAIDDGREILKYLREDDRFRPKKMEVEK
jgi:hypothetical protein